jgi:hypothetical protein
MFDMSDYTDEELQELINTDLHDPVSDETREMLGEDMFYELSYKTIYRARVELARRHLHS